MIVGLFVLLAFLGPVAGLVGYTYLSSEPEILSAIMLCAAVGIMYSVFQNIAHNVQLKQHWFPPMGVVPGFVLGLLGHS